MNRWLPIAALVCSLAALGVTLLHDEAPAVAPAAPAPASSDVGRIENLEQRVAVMEQTVSRFAARLTALENHGGGAPPATGNAPPSDLAGEVARLRAEVQGMTVGESMNTDSGRAQLKDALRSLQTEMFEDARRSATESWVTNQREGSAERLQRWKEFVGKAQLNYGQEQELLKRMEAEETKRKALADEVAAGTKNPRDVQRDLRLLRSENDEALKKLLTPEQQSQFSELRRADRWGGRVRK